MKLGCIFLNCIALFLNVNPVISNKYFIVLSKSSHVPVVASAYLQQTTGYDSKKQLYNKYKNKKIKQVRKDVLTFFTIETCVPQQFELREFNVTSSLNIIFDFTVFLARAHTHTVH